MTITNIRKMITVESFSNDLTGAEFVYRINNEPKTLTCGFDTLLTELLAIGSIDKKWELLEGYKISQWDALNIAIRHEYRNYLEADNEKTDIFGALANIINPHK